MRCRYLGHSPPSLLAAGILLDSIQSLTPKIKLPEEPSVTVGVGCIIKNCDFQPECLALSVQLCPSPYAVAL